MKNEYSISEELMSLGSVLADLPRHMPYSVPEGYFENFAGNLSGTINELGVPDITPVWSKAMPYVVPVGYFEELTGKIVAAATAENITFGMAKEMPFNAPAGYFEIFPAQVLSAAKATEPVKKQTKTIPFGGNNLFRTIRWAAAAVLLLGIGFGSYNILFNEQQADHDRILASVPNDVIHDYLAHTYRLDIDRIVNNTDINSLDIDNKDIVQYLNETGWDVVE
jgi:hypothetical protein